MLIVVGALVLVILVAIIVLIAKQKGNRAVVALGGAVASYFIIIIINQDGDPAIMISFLFGSPVDNYANFHSLLLIFGMITIINIAMESGLFQFIGFSIFKRAKGSPRRMFFVICGITVLLSTVLDNLLVLLIMIPLVVSISRLLDVKPLPYLLSIAVMVNIGGTVFSIASISNILITNYAGITFQEFFLGVGPISLVVAACSTVFLYFLVRPSLGVPRRDLSVLMGFDALTFVPDKKLMYKAAITFASIIVLLLAIPSNLFPLDLIVLAAMFILILWSRMNTNEILKEIDVELFLYLIGISIVTGCLNYSGLMQYLGDFITMLAAGNPAALPVVVLWLSAVSSVTVDNVPMTQIYMPTIKAVSGGSTAAFFSLTLGIGWGDSLTPFGDNVIVIKTAEAHQVHISMKDFFAVSLASGIFQLFLATIYFVMLSDVVAGIVLIGILAAGIAAFVLLKRYIFPKLLARGTSPSHQQAPKL
jgi:Na+/H+ antiporter NhaD/arsenite permease-like protein